MRGYFVTGTDTDIGKTVMATALIHALTQTDARVAAMKPVAAGAELRNGELHNDDADRLAAAANVALPAVLATPYLLREAAAPHIAARMEGVSIKISHILACARTAAQRADLLVVEGVGGFRVPLSDAADTADMAQQLGLPVVLVVGLRLGCISAALLTAEAIAARGLPLAGWIANGMHVDFPHSAANVEAIAARMPAPLLGYVPQLADPTPQLVASHINFSFLPGWPGRNGV